MTMFDTNWRISHRVTIARFWALWDFTFCVWAFVLMILDIFTPAVILTWNGLIVYEAYFWAGAVLVATHLTFKSFRNLERVTAHEVERSNVV